MEIVETVEGGRAVRFLAKDKVRLNGLLFPGKPRGTSCLIYIHGMGGGMMNGIPIALARQARKGTALFSFSNRGHDIISSSWRMGGKKNKRILAGLNFERFEESAHDIYGAIAALRRLGYRKFILCGHSTGCQKAIYYQYKARDSRVAGLVLLGPCDDYNLYRRMLGRRHGRLLAKCRRLMKKGKGNEVPDRSIGFCAQRLDSIIDLERIEARLLDYNGDLKEFGSIKEPMLAVFGSKEENRLMPVKRYLEILDVRSGSRRLSRLEMEGANHSFYGKEDELAKIIYAWVSDLRP